MSTDTSNCTTDWTIVCHLDYGDQRKISIVKQRDGKISTVRLDQSPALGGDINHCHKFLGCNANDEAIVMDPATKTITTTATPPADIGFAYAYRDPSSTRVWFVNDGDKRGNDALMCGGVGSPVSIINKDGESAEHLESLCVGRGHHMTAFTQAVDGSGNIPNRAFSSNLQDGTISVIGNDPSDAVSFLKTIVTINLADPRFEKDGTAELPNNAFPHGMEFSPLTGKVYNLNNGYGTIAVIDPLTHEIESTIEMKVSSNLLLSRCGRFLIGKGADRKSNAEHVLGRLSVVDAVKGEMGTVLDLQDMYPSVYRFNAAGDKLYVTLAATGKGAQADNLITGLTQVYDTSNLPELKLIKEIKHETTSAGRRPIAIMENGPYIFVPNPTHGTLTIIDGHSDEVVNTVDVGEGGMKEFSFSFWNDRAVYGA